MKNLGISIKIFLILTLLTGVVYPLLVTGIAQVAFSYRANGSMIIKNNQLVGSELIGQKSDSIIYFSARPSACDYNALASGGSNYGQTSAKLKALVSERQKRFIQFNGLAVSTEVPSEMLFASASGLDPHISPEAALLQLNRVAQARHFSNRQKEKLKSLLNKLSEQPQLGFLGESRVNVLKLNIELDKLK